MTEEDIRGNLILPYLKDLGFEVSEISLERAFIIRLGRSKQKTGRSDILCKRHNKNLFVIELKSDSISITQDDIDQGISYARLLLDDIAPFTIVTNGKITRIFDSISRKEISGSKISDQSSFWKNGYTLTTDEELRIRYEALKNFISLSPENLKHFCDNQVRDRMGQIIGGIDSPYSKFVKELHVQRKDLQNVYENFVNSNNSIFGLVGSAGTGKTSVFCSLALQSLKDKFVFFYNAAIIKSPLESITQDLNMHFSSRNDSDTVLKKLDELGRYANKNVLIFIDAIDENTNPDISIELSDMALAAKYLEKVKIIISCKSNIWNSILKPNNTPTHLYEELSKSHNTIDSLNNCPGYLLNEFTEEELETIIPLYQKAFGFKGTISNLLLENLRNGFFLRIFSEVYYQRQIPQKIDDKNLIKKYINQSLEKANIDKISALRILSKIGFILINHKYTEWEAYKDEGLDLEYLLKELNFSLDENIPEELFSRNLLIRSNNEDSYNISFYYSKIRDYIICFHSYKLDKKSDIEFYEVLDEIYQNHIGQSAISFYLENACESHKATLIKFKKDKALKYVTSYNSYLDSNFKPFKDKFIPKTNEDIGIVLPQDLLNEDGYALFPLESGSTDRILYENLDFDDNYYESRLYQIGVGTIYGSNIPLLVKDPNKIVRKNIFKQLKDIIEKGKIGTYNSDILLLEQVSVILYFYSAKLGYDFKIKDFNLPRYDLIYPIYLNNLKERINKFRLVEHFKRQSVDRNHINEMVEKALKEHLEIPKFNVTGDVPPFEELYKNVELLLRKGYDKIDAHYLPLPDKSISEAKAIYEQNRKQNIHNIRSIEYSQGQATSYIEYFFMYIESCYKSFVEYCFPTFKEDFAFYKTIPHEYYFYMKDSDILKWGMFGHRPSESGKIKININESVDWTSDKAFKVDKVTILHSFSLEDILYNDHNSKRIKTIDKINTPKVDDFCVMRSWVYRLLKNDIRQLFKENGENI
ncbi:MAG: type I restriction enzyme HsdR N-terminal domain-containing protein [Bacteroidales bacterium]